MLQELPLLFFSIQLELHRELGGCSQRKEIQDGKVSGCLNKMYTVKAGHDYTDPLCEWKMNIYYVKPLKI